MGIYPFTPFGGQPLGFGYLFASHPLLCDVFVILRILISLGRREIEPHVGEHNILRDAVAIPVHNPEVVLGIHIPLLGR